jgi:aspartate racemase
MKTIRISDRHKILGILGGMGPEAGIDFYRQVLAFTPASRDQDHIPTILLSHTQVPDRTESILRGHLDCLPALIEGVAFLEHAGAEVIAIPCNTAHYYIEDLRAAIQTTLLSIVEETVSAILATPESPGCVAVFGTEGIRATNLYGRALEAGGLRYIYPDITSQQRITEIIRSVKSGKAGSEERNQLMALAEEARKSGAEALLLGCTELPILFRGHPVPLPVYDSTSLLAKAAVRFCINV